MRPLPALMLFCALLPRSGYGEDYKEECRRLAPDPRTVNHFYEDNPTYAAPLSDGAFWPTGTPENQGMSTPALEKASAALEKIPQSFSFLVARNGVLVWERYFHGSRVNDSNNVHSASKSMLSGLVGIAIRDGFLDGTEQKLADLIPDRLSLPKKKRSLKLKHLLTMSAGLRWAEDESEDDIEMSPDWAQAILNLPVQGKPGAQYGYNTGLTHLLSVVLTENTGMDTCEFATRKLFAPLGVTVEHWGRDPQGYYSGGYNLYLTAREFLAVAQLYLQEGKWNGTQVIPSHWVRESLESHLVAHDEYDYGYLWFHFQGAGRRIHKMWGHGGQFGYVVPAEGLVVVLTADTKREYTEMDGNDFLTRYVLPALR